MANTVSGFYQTVVAAMTDACKALVHPCNAVNAVYRDYSPQAATIGQVLNIPIPAVRTGGVADAGVGDISLTDATQSTVTITFNKHPYDALVIRDFEQYNSPTSLRDVFLDPAIKGIMENINNTICALATTSNFTTNTAIATTGGLITTTQLLAGKAALIAQRVPTDDPANMSLIQAGVPYTKMLDNATWTQAQIAGDATATEIRRTGVLPTTFGFTHRLEPQMPVSGTAPTRTFTAAYLHRYAIALATRPLAAPESNVVEASYHSFAGIPLRVMLGYNQYPKLGYVLTVDAGYGLAVVRENMGQLFTVAE